MLFRQNKKNIYIFILFKCWLLMRGFSFWSISERKKLPNTKLHIDEPLKAINVIDFLLFSFVLGLIDITAAGY